MPSRLFLSRLCNTKNRSFGCTLSYCLVQALTSLLISVVFSSQEIFLKKKKGVKLKYHIPFCFQLGLIKTLLRWLMNKPKQPSSNGKKHSCSTQKRELSFSHFLLLRLKFEKKEPRLSGPAISRARSHCEKLGFSSLRTQLSSKDETVWSHSLLFPRKQAGAKVLRKQQQQQRFGHGSSFFFPSWEKAARSGLNIRSHLLVPYKKGNVSKQRPHIFPSWFHQPSHHTSEWQWSREK